MALCRFMLLTVNQPSCSCSIWSSGYGCEFCTDQVNKIFILSINLNGLLFLLIEGRFQWIKSAAFISHCRAEWIISAQENIRHIMNGDMLPLNHFLGGRKLVAKTHSPMQVMFLLSAQSPLFLQLLSTNKNVMTLTGRQQWSYPENVLKNVMGGKSMAFYQ